MGQHNKEIMKPLGKYINRDFPANVNSRNSSHQQNEGTETFNILFSIIFDLISLSKYSNKWNLFSNAVILKSKFIYKHGNHTQNSPVYQQVFVLSLYVSLEYRKGIKQRIMQYCLKIYTKMGSSWKLYMNLSMSFCVL